MIALPALSLTSAMSRMADLDKQADFWLGVKTEDEAQSEQVKGVLLGIGEDQYHLDAFIQCSLLGEEVYGSIVHHKSWCVAEFSIDWEQYKKLDPFQVRKEV